MIRLNCTRMLAAALVAASLSGCAGALPAIGAAASIAGYLDKFYSAGADTIAATAIACQRLSAAAAVAPKRAALSQPWYAPICNHLTPSNRAITPAAAAWIAEGAGKLKAETTIMGAR